MLAETGKSAVATSENRNGATDEINVKQMKEFSMK